MVAGAPFFLAVVSGLALGVSPSAGVAVGLGEGVSDSTGVAVGDGEVLRFFFLGEGLGDESGDGLGEAFFFAGEGETLGSDSSDGVGLEVAFFFVFDARGEGDFSGVADGFGVGNFSASSFFFGAGELLRCFRGVGVGVGSKIFLILLPNDCSACARSATARSMASERMMPAILLTLRMERENSTRTGDEYRAARG
jgi:hypothetical protein